MSFSNNRLQYWPHELDVTVLLAPFYDLFFSNHVIVAVTFNRVSEFLSAFMHKVYTAALTVIQLFREMLSYKRRKAYATMSKVVMGKVFQRG